MSQVKREPGRVFHRIGIIQQILDSQHFSGQHFGIELLRGRIIGVIPGFNFETVPTHRDILQHMGQSASGIVIFIVFKLVGKIYRFARLTIDLQRNPVTQPTGEVDTGVV